MMMKNLFDLTGKTALLVGAAGNLGPVWGKTLLDAGVMVYAIGQPFQDFTEDSIKWIDSIRGYRVDIIVCNAAIDIPPSCVGARFFTDFEKIIQVNVNAHARVIEQCLPYMIMQGEGVIILIGSIMGYIGADWRNYSGGFEKPCAYNCSKAALQQLARSITVQYGRYGIRAVCPGFGPVDTGKLSSDFLNKIRPQIPMGRPVSIDSLKRTLLYACCCDDLAGEDWLIDGGYTKW
jgi:NAD(P)-dependent dehydrogenase (short-subunit alcohol dehydrogenase family)